MLQYMTEAFNKYLMNQPLGEESVIKTKSLLKVVNGQKSEFSSLRGGLLITLPLLEMMNSSVFKSKICRPQFIQTIALMIDNCENTQKTSQATAQVFDELRRALFLIAESLAKHNKLLITHHKEIIENLLPILVKKLDSQSADIRFLSLKLFTDYITQFLCEDKIYNSEENTDTTQAINELILKKLFSYYGHILADKDPMPLFGLKLLSVIVERNSAFVAVLKKLNLVGILLEYFSVGHPKFNTFTVKIVKQIVASRDLELSELCSPQM